MSILEKEDQHINYGKNHYTLFVKELHIMENKTTSYDLEGVIYHQHSNKLMKKILEYFPKDIPVLDIGCGHNFYVSVLNYAGYKARGCDEVDLGHRAFFPFDVTKPMTNIGRVQNIISLEVGEHIPFELCAGYLDNLCRFGGDVIMSWAVPGQAGIGHVNCQDRQWVIEQMWNRGYTINKVRTDSMRTAVADCHCSWFQNTLMYFTPKEK